MKDQWITPFFKIGDVITYKRIEWRVVEIAGTITSGKMTLTVEKQEQPHYWETREYDGVGQPCCAICGKRIWRNRAHVCQKPE